MALRGRVSGGESSGEQESDDALCKGFKCFDEPYTSVSIRNFQYLVNKSIAKDVPMARGQQSSPIKPREIQSTTLQTERQRPALQQPVTPSEHPSQETLSFHVKPSGSLQNGGQETTYQRRLSSSNPTATGPHKELAHAQEKAEEKRQKELDSVGYQAKSLNNSKQVQTRSDRPNGSKIHPLATGSTSSLRRRNPQPWPEPQQSLGQVIETNNKKIKGKVWVAEGPALELFEAQIRPQIERLLHNTEPPQCAPLLLTLYMIGKAEKSASPTIMICCCDRKVRKDAEAIIRESDVLQQFPQMGLGNSASLLETSSFVFPATERSTASHLGAKIPERHSFDVPASAMSTAGQWNATMFEGYSLAAPNTEWSTAGQWYTQIPERHSFAAPGVGRSTASQKDTQIPPRFKIHGFQKPVIGRRLRFVRIIDGKETVKFSTGGPFIRIGNHTYQLTATHMSQNIGTDLEMHFGSDDDCEYDGQSDTDGEEVAVEDGDDHNGVGTGMPGNQQGNCNIPLKTGGTSQTTGTDAEKEILLERFHRQDLWTAQDTADVGLTLSSSSKVDYFLVKLPAEEAGKASNEIENLGLHGTLQVTGILSTLPNPGTEVVVVTLFNHLSGIVLPGKTRVKMHGFDGFQNLVAMRLSSPIKAGDSGSAVLDASTGCFYGHIALGSAPDTVAYMVPAIDTFTDILAAFGKLPTMRLQPSITNVEPPKGIMENEQDDLSAYTDSSDPWGYPSVFTGHTDPSDTVSSDEFPRPERHLAQNSLEPMQADISIYEGYGPPSTAPRITGRYDHHSINERYQLPCEFRNLTGCVSVFNGDDKQGWMDHIEGHLRSQFPTRLSCWFCSDNKFDARETAAGDTRSNFNIRMQHIYYHIIYEGYRARYMQMDGHIVQHLLDSNLIDRSTYERIINPTTVPRMSGSHDRHSSNRAHRRLPQVDEEVVAESSSRHHHRHEHRREHNREHGSTSHKHRRR